MLFTVLSLKVSSHNALDVFVDIYLLTRLMEHFIKCIDPQ